jgi:putative effector of murein hydrolase
VHRARHRSYVASAAGLPPSIGRFLPPTVCSGLGIVALLGLCGWSRGGGMESVRADASLYMDGAGKILMTPVPPALITLGLMAHTHRNLLRQRLGPVMLTTIVGAPVAFIGVGLIGSRILGAPAEEVASMLPGTTTTGLALTMHGAAHPLARAEWLALGPTVCGLSGMVAWPAILAIGGLSAVPPWIKGFAVGSASHVAGMAALTAAGETAAAEWAALAFFLFGTYRCVLLQLDPYRDVVRWACGETDRRETPIQPHPSPTTPELSCRDTNPSVSTT